MGTPFLLTVTRAFACALALTTPWAWSQTEAAPEPVFPKNTPAFRNLEAEAYLRQKLPRTYAHLLKRQGFHTVVIGDSIANYLTHDDSRYDWLKAYPVVFLRELAKDHFLTGGVRLIKPKKGKLAKNDDLVGPEITVHNLSRNGLDVYGASLIVRINALDTKPDLILFNIGVNDALGGVPITRFKSALQSTLGHLVNQQVDVLVLGPTTVARPPANRHLGLTRPYAEAARDVAGTLGLPFVDLGAMEGMLPSYRSPETAAKYGDRTSEAARQAFEFGTVNDGVHPNGETHFALGKEIHRALLDPRPPLGITIENLSWERDGGSLTANFEVVEQTGQAQQLLLAPLPFSRAWKAETRGLEVSLDAGQRSWQRIGFVLAPFDADSFHWEQVSENGNLPLPLLLGTKNRSALITPRGPLGPLLLEWPYGLQANVASEEPGKPPEVLVSATLNNRGDERLEGTISAEWNGQKAEGGIALPAKGVQMARLRFQFPGDMVAVRKPVNIVVTEANGRRHPFSAFVEANRNIGLGEAVPMVREDQYLANSDTAYVPIASPGVVFQPFADGDGLYFVFDIDGLQLHDHVEAPSALIEIHLDARSTEFRSGPGATAPLRISFPVVGEGPGTVAKIPLGVFGETYDLQIPEGAVKSFLSKREDGGTRLAVTLPRTLFAGRHRWNLGDSNSQLGLAATLSLPTEEGTYPSERRFHLSAPRMPKGDAESLATLELAEPSSGRWSVRIYP